MSVENLIKVEIIKNKPKKMGLLVSVPTLKNEFKIINTDQETSKKPSLIISFLLCSEILEVTKIIPIETILNITPIKETLSPKALMISLSII